MFLAKEKYYFKKKKMIKQLTKTVANDKLKCIYWVGAVSHEKRKAIHLP